MSLNTSELLLLTNVPAYAELFVNENSDAVAIPQGTTFTRIILHNATVGGCRGCTVDLENGTITVHKGGKYLVNCSFSSRLGTSTVMWDTAVFVNNEEQLDLHMRRKFSTAGYVFNVALTGIVSLNAGDVVDIRVKHDIAGSVNIINEYASILIDRRGR